MADEGSSIWGEGIDEEGNRISAFALPSRTTKMASSLTEAKGDPEGTGEGVTPRLFDDLADAGWGAPEGEGEGQVRTTRNDDVIAREGFDPINKEVVEETKNQRRDSIGFKEFDENQNNRRTEGDADDSFGELGGGGDVDDDDDDFGDFGDFDEGQTADAFDSIAAEEHTNAPAAQQSSASSSRSAWQPLHFTPNSNSSSIASEIRDLLSLPFADGRIHPFHDGVASQLSQDKIRQVEGSSQVLVREESRKVWEALSSQPNLKPVDWMRSKTRRQYLIAIGVPINLDELASPAGVNGGAKTLPPLALNLGNGDENRSNAGMSSKSSSIGPGGRAAKEREASKPPEFDVERAKAIIALTEDNLTLQSLPALRTLLREVEGLTRQASTVLTHYLSQRESHNADAEMYNGLIRDLVTGAAKRVSTQNVQGAGTGAGGVGRKSSVRLPNTSSGGSGRNSPAFVGASARSNSPRT